MHRLLNQNAPCGALLSKVKLFPPLLNSASQRNHYYCGNPLSSSNYSQITSLSSSSSLFLSPRNSCVREFSQNTRKSFSSSMPTEKHCDLAVIGGGSGGLAAAKEAAACGAKVVLFDYVEPTVHGTKWGLGGTCVNVGCVPKKLMHYAGICGEILRHDAKVLGYGEGWMGKMDWSTLVQTVQNHVRSLNFSYRGGLRSAKVEYINAFASFSSPNQLRYVVKGEEAVINPKYVLLAMGGRPHVPDDIPGARELAITSDDLFSLKKDPGKTLIVGASYIALECAGFLTGLGYDVTVAVRSILLRGFDRQCAEKIGSFMEELGTRFLYDCNAASLTKVEDSQKISVQFASKEGSPPKPQEFDTVVFATGRNPVTQRLGLDLAGVNVLPNNKIEAVDEQTNVPHIFAVGDILHNRPELTPVAIRAAELLARRLFSNSNKRMDYSLVPTAVFTPIEYGCCGLSEEEAEKKYSRENIEVYLSEFTSLEIASLHREKVVEKRVDEFDSAISPNCLAKLVCLKTEDDRVLGFHFVGPNAGEITQGMALSMRLGAKKADFDEVIGIHPTDAESFTSLTVTKSSGESWVAAGGCGGGKCG